MQKAKRKRFSLQQNYFVNGSSGNAYTVLLIPDNCSDTLNLCIHIYQLISKTPFLAAKMSLKEIRQLYFKLKEEVFANPNFGIGFNTDALERLLLELPGAKMRMSEVRSPK